MPPENAGQQGVAGLAGREKIPGLTNGLPAAILWVYRYPVGVLPGEKIQSNQFT